MAISNKTRKTLWARSGNRCLLCRIELVQEVPECNANLIVGEECHIVSSKKDGPRGNISISYDFDDYQNLMLLCANDHKRVDELTTIYTLEVLSQFKALHENWVRTTLEKDISAFVNDQTNIKSMEKVFSGKQVIDLIDGAHLFDFDHDEVQSSKDAELIGNFFEGLKEWSDILSDIGFSERIKLGIDYTGYIQELQSAGFTLFGLRRSVRLRSNENKDMGLYDVASLLVLQSDNPGIIGNFVITEFPTHFNFS